MLIHDIRNHGKSLRLNANKYLKNIHVQSVGIIPSKESMVIVNLNTFGFEVIRQVCTGFFRLSATEIIELQSIVKSLLEKNLTSVRKRELGIFKHWLNNT